MSVTWSPRLASVIGGLLDGGTVRVYGNNGGAEPAVVTLAYGATQEEPWPHVWLDYHRHPDGTYRYTQPGTEAA